MIETNRSGELHLSSPNDEPRIFWPGWLRSEHLPMIDLLGIEYQSDMLLESDSEADRVTGAWLQDELIMLSEMVSRYPVSMQIVWSVASRAAELWMALQNRRGTCEK
jgi:hypothetical protein